jgi:hypothetical protein
MIIEMIVGGKIRAFEQAKDAQCVQRRAITVASVLALCRLVAFVVGFGLQ